MEIALPSAGRWPRRGRLARNTHSLPPGAVPYGVRVSGARFRHLRPGLSGRRRLAAQSARFLSQDCRATRLRPGGSPGIGAIAPCPKPLARPGGGCRAAPPQADRPNPIGRCLMRRRGARYPPTPAQRHVRFAPRRTRATAWRVDHHHGGTHPTAAAGPGGDYHPKRKRQRGPASTTRVARLGGVHAYSRPRATLALMLTALRRIAAPAVLVIALRSCRPPRPRPRSPSPPRPTRSARRLHGSWPARCAVLSPLPISRPTRARRSCFQRARRRTR